MGEKSVTVPSRMGFWFFEHPGLVSEGDPFKDVHGAEQPHPVVLPLNQPKLSTHNTQLCTYKQTTHEKLMKIYLCIIYIIALLKSVSMLTLPHICILCSNHSHHI